MQKDKHWNFIQIGLAFIFFAVAYFMKTLPEGLIVVLLVLGIGLFVCGVWGYPVSGNYPLKLH